MFQFVNIAVLVGTMAIEITDNKWALDWLVIHVLEFFVAEYSQVRNRLIFAKFINQI